MNTSAIVLRNFKKSDKTNEPMVRHLNLFEKFCKDNQAMLDWFQKVLVRENSRYIENAFPTRGNVEMHWNSSECALILSYTSRGSVQIKISEKGVKLVTSTIHKSKSAEVEIVYKIFAINLNLMRNNLKIAFGKEAERLLGYVLP